jgi:hypothetical protein
MVRTCAVYHVNDWPRHVGAIGKLLDYSGLHVVHHLFGRTKTLTSSWARDDGFGIERRLTMRVMVIVKASEESEAGQMPSQQLLAEMGKFNEELVKAGVMLAGDGLHPSSKGKRVKFSGARRTVIDGPFSETKELVAGYWLWQVTSMNDAVEWLKKAPFDGGTEVEIRPVFEADDFGAEFTPELRAQEARLRARIGAKQ